QRLAFVVEDYLGRQPVDFVAGYSPGNQQQVNVFNAGPSLFVRFGDAMRGQLDLRYSDTHAEETREFNGSRYLAGGRLFRDLGQNRMLSANVEATRVRFDVDASNDYDRYDGYVGYRRESPRLDLDAALGYTRIEPDDGTGSQSSPLARVQLDWRPAPRSVISASASYQFADTASDLVANSNRLDQLVIDDIAVATGLVGPSVYRQRRYELGYRFEGERWTFQARPYVDRVDYEDALLPGWQTRGGYVDAGYRQQPQLTLKRARAREDRECDGGRADGDSPVRDG